MKLTILVLSVFFLAGCYSTAYKSTESPVTREGVVNIIWQNPQQYSDIKASSELQSYYQQRLFKVLTHDLNKRASKVLKHGQQLDMLVTNVDLAGDVQPTFGAAVSELRVIQHMYPPKISFSYKVMQGEHLLMSGKEKLVDVNFLGGIHPLIEEPFMYENALLTHWFNKTIAPKLEGVPPK